MTDEIKPCIHAEVCAEGCDLEDITECGYYRAERTCRFALEEDREKLAEKAGCGPGEFATQDMPQLLWTCSACGVQYRNSIDVLPDWIKHCPECGAKVAR